MKAVIGGVVERPAIGLAALKNSEEAVGSVATRFGLPFCL